MIEAATPTLSQGQPEDLGEFGGWDVYSMPVFIRLLTPDVERTARWFTDAAVDDLAVRAAEHGRVDGPRDPPWNTRDVTVYDPNGNAFVFAGRLTSAPAMEFDDIMKDSGR